MISRLHIASAAAQQGAGVAAPDIAALGPSLLLDERGWAVASDLLTQQDDQSGNGYSFAQGKRGNRPIVGGLEQRRIGNVDVATYLGAARWQPSVAATLAQIFSAPNAFILAVVDLDSLANVGTPATYYAGSGIFAEASNVAKLTVYTHLRAPKAAFGANGTAAAQADCSTGIHLLQGRKAGTTLGIRVDGDAEVTAAGPANYSATTGLMRTGRGNEAAMLRGAIACIACWQAEPSAEVIAEARSILATKYGVLGSGVSKVMPCGDSITLGFVSGTGNTGGWRPRSSSGRSTATGRIWQMVGPFLQNGLHRGVSGEKASDIVAAIATFQTQLTTYAPDVLVLGWGTNDLGNGTSTAAQLLTDYGTIIAAARSTLPSVKIVVNTVVPPGPANAVYFANLAQYTSANASILGGALDADDVANVGSPTLGDGTHPTGDTAGYGSMYTPVRASIQAVAP